MSFIRGRPILGALSITGHVLAAFNQLSWPFLLLTRAIMAANVQEVQKEADPEDHPAEEGHLDTTGNSELAVAPAS